MSYARGTDVPVDRSRAEIETILKRYGADAFGYFVETTRAVIMFRAHDRHVKFLLPLPIAKDFSLDKAKRMRTAKQQMNAREAETRRRFRALALVIKAKLEAVHSGIVTFEAEFLAHIVLPDGETVGAWMAPQIELAYATGEMPFLRIEGPKS